MCKNFSKSTIQLRVVCPCPVSQPVAMVQGNYQRGGDSTLCSGDRVSFDIEFDERKAVKELLICHGSVKT